jgi:hypothetical protein
MAAVKPGAGLVGQVKEEVAHLEAPQVTPDQAVIGRAPRVEYLEAIEVMLRQHQERKADF